MVNLPLTADTTVDTQRCSWENTLGEEKEEEEKEEETEEPMCARHGEEFSW